MTSRTRGRIINRALNIVPYMYTTSDWLMFFLKINGANIVSARREFNFFFFFYVDKTDLKKIMFSGLF